MAQHALDLRTTRPPSWARRLRRVDVVLITSTLVVAAVGVVIVYSATRNQLAAAGYSPHYYLDRQALFVFVGACVMAVVAWVDLQRIEDLAVILYVGLILALVAVKLPGIGSSQLGSQRWFQFGPVQVQPSAFAAPIVVVVVAAYLGRSVQRRGELLTLRRLAAAIGIAGLPLLLVVVQPDLGSGIVIGVALLTVLIAAGTRFGHIAILFVLAAIGVFAIIHLHLLHQYQLSRLTGFLHQGNGEQYNLVQSKDAIGSGGIHGTGLFRGPQTNNAYVPEQQTDFIFTAVGEQLGFVGAGSLLAILGIVVWRLLRAAQRASDPFGRLVCVGVLGIVAFSIFENVGMTMGLMPIAGIPLPFVSYGGSAVVAFFTAIGLALNVEYRAVRRGGSGS